MLNDDYLRARSDYLRARSDAWRQWAEMEANARANAYDGVPVTQGADLERCTTAFEMADQLAQRFLAVGVELRRQRARVDAGVGDGTGALDGCTTSRARDPWR